jgi:hypothetical protein
MIGEQLRSNLIETLPAQFTGNFGAQLDGLFNRPLVSAARL